jgi:RNA polymerase sigma-70 factor (ECF subfamily)
MENRNERELVNELIRGELPAFDALFEKYYKKLYYFALGYLRSEEDAEDLIQEVFVKIWETRKDIKEYLSFNSFLYTITYHAVLKHFRKKGREKKYVDRYAAGLKEYIDITTAEVEYSNTLERVNIFVEQLPEKRKQIFIMSRYEGFDNTEIAKKLNISKKTVENQIYQALKFLRTQLNKESLMIGIVFYLFLN